MAEEKTPEFNPFQTGALFQQHERRWLLEQDFAEPTLDIFESGVHLDKFSEKESKQDYNYRKSMSVPLDMCPDAIRIRHDNIFRTPPNREAAGPHKALIDQLILDADGDGTTLDEFMSKALTGYYSTGCDIVTQMPAAPVDSDGNEVPIKTLADQQAAGMQPYFLQFNPLQRNDWATKGNGNFLWARYTLGEEPAADEQSGASGDTLFLTLSADKWVIWRGSEDDEGEIHAVIERTGDNPLSIPPITKLYFTESQKPGQGAVPISLISRSAMIARVLINLKSQADVDLLAAVARWMFTGMEEPPDQFGPLSLVHSKSADSKLFVVQSDVDHIKEKREWLMLYVTEILRLLKFRGGMGSVDVSSGSGVRLALEMTDLTTEMKETASLMEATELEMMRQAVSLSTGEEIKPQDAQEVLQYSVHYTTDFILEPVKAMLDNLSILLTKSGFVAEQVPSLIKEMLRQVSGQLVRDGSPVADDITKEIDAIKGDGVSEASTPEPVVEAE